MLVSFMTKISKETKIKAINEFLFRKRSVSMTNIAHKYGISKRSFQIMFSVYQRHGPTIFTNPPKITVDFRIQLVLWMIQSQASYTETAIQFGYLSVAQMYQWRKIYLQQGPDGLRSIEKGRPSMTKKKQIKAAKKSLKTKNKDRIAELEERVQELEIKNALLKELASMKKGGLLK